MIAKLFAKYQSIGLITLSLLAGAIMTFIALPVLTRLYSVADFGAYGIALTMSVFYPRLPIYVLIKHC